METSDRPSSNPATGTMTAPPADSAARRAGLLLLLTAVVTMVMVVTRVSADADQPTLAESVWAIAENRAVYSVSGVARFISGITLLAGAWFLLRTWIIRERRATPLVPALFISSGIFTALAGAATLALAALAAEPSAASRLVENADPVGAPTEAMDYLRWITGKIGFTAAGLALVVAARYHWKVGGILRYVSPASAVLGIAMLFIWWDAATLLHRITGPAFVVWLVFVGAMLLTGRVERRFIAMARSSPPN